MNPTLKNRNSGVRVGDGCPTRIMALIGASSGGDYREQVAKIEALSEMRSGPEIIGDLSIRTSDLPLWRRIVQDTSLVAATLPIYTATVTNNRIDPEELIDIAYEQVESGVGLLTIHPTPTAELIDKARTRLVPWTSRGGGLVIRDLIARGFSKQNVYLQILPQLSALAKRTGTVLSLGASFRSANIFDSADPAQIAEIQMQVALAKDLISAGASVIIESPGHARPNSIRQLARLLKQAGVPIMPLGPIPTDAAIGQDHISAAIGATLLGLEGCAHILACVTREEHTGGVPSLRSTLEAVECARIAAHVIDLDMLGDTSLDEEIARHRAEHRTCIYGNMARGCPRCGDKCPL